MKPMKVLTGTIKSLRNLHLHILLTEEDSVIVARCLDFSVSSHGDNEEDALASLSDSIKDYLDHAIQKGALNEIIDPEDDKFWKIYRQLELENESMSIIQNIDILKKNITEKVVYAKNS